LDGLFNNTTFFSFILGVGGRLLPSGVYHGGVSSIGGRGARAARLHERVENYWITPFLNGDYATIFPTGMDVLKQMLFGGSSSSSEHPRTIRKLFRNRQGELVATDWTFPPEEQQEEEESKTTNVCIFLAGVGGDSSSVYVRECT
jgi:hypothetical protein